MRATRLGTSAAALGSVALAGLALSGCSSGGSPSAAAAAVSSLTASPSPTGLAAKLLTPRDLPAGWSAEASPTDAPLSTGCPLLNAPIWNASLPNRAEADLSKGLSGPYLVEQIAAGTAAQAGQAWQTISGSLKQCTTSYTHKGSTGQSTYTLAETRELPSYGDSSYAFTLDIAITGGVNASGDIVAARSGNSVVVLYVVGLTGVSKSDVEGIVSTAVTKAHT